MSQLVRLEGKHSTQNAHCALVSIKASIRCICYLNISDKILWVEKKREEEKFGRGRAGSQQKIANLPGPPESKMRIVHL